MIVVLPGQNVRLNWTFVGNPSKSTLVWYFTRRSVGSKEEEIAFKRRTHDTEISNSSLPGVVIENPATLVLKDVDARYNGKYRFVVLSSRYGESSVELFVAGKFFYENFKKIQFVI